MQLMNQYECVPKNEKHLKQRQIRAVLISLPDSIAEVESER